MKFTISNRLRLGIVSLGGLALLNLGLIDMSVRGLGEGASFVSYTGRLRSLSQRMVKWHLLGNEAEAQESEQRLPETLAWLRNGNAEQGVPKATNAEYIAKLDELDKLWQELKQAEAAADRDAKLNARLVEVGERFYDIANEATQIATQYEKDLVQKARIETLLYTLVSLVGVTIIWFFVEQVVKTLRGSTKTMTATSAQIAATVEEQERYLSDQAASVNETTTTIEELGASSRQAAEQASASAAGSQQALALSGDGSKIVSQTIEGISELQQKVEAIAQKIMQLSEQTAQISGISDLVADIANQTNMLSLNAAVEAARAGEQGKGFAVVAGEVRKLAEQSKKSAEKINGLVSEVQSSINSTIMVTDEGTKTAQVGIRLANETANAFNGIAQSVNDVFLNSQQIALSAKQQAVAVQQAVSAMNAINLGSQETAAGVNQVRAATQGLATTAQELQAIV
jgi:methyl-accepting chemotaxis protein